MGIVEPDEPLAARAVQGERVVDAMRLFRRHAHARHHETDPMSALGIDHEDIPIEIEKRIKRRITPFRHDIQLSY